MADAPVIFLHSGAPPGLVLRGEPPRLTYGEPAIMVEKDADCKDCGRRHDIEKCPKCGSWIELGYGLMGGGFGAYKFCRNDACDWFYKEYFECDGCGGQATVGSPNGGAWCADCAAKENTHG